MYSHYENGCLTEGNELHTVLTAKSPKTAHTSSQPDISLNIQHDISYSHTHAHQHVNRDTQHR